MAEKIHFKSVYVSKSCSLLLLTSQHTKSHLGTCNEGPGLHSQPMLVRESDACWVLNGDAGDGGRLAGRELLLKLAPCVNLSTPH